MAKGILIAAMDFSAVAPDEFDDWYDTEHIPERLAVPGFLNAERWLGAANPKQSVALYDLDEVGVLQSAPYRAVGGANGSPWTKRVTGRTKSIMRLEGEQLRPGDALAPVGQAAALLLIAMNVAPEQENEFNEWYNAEHLPQLSAVPGVLWRPALSRQRRDAALCRDLSFRQPRRAQLGGLEERRQHAVDRAHAAAFPRSSCASTADGMRGSKFHRRGGDHTELYLLSRRRPGSTEPNAQEAEADPAFAG